MLLSLTGDKAPGEEEDGSLHEVKWVLHARWLMKSPGVDCDLFVQGFEHL